MRIRITERWRERALYLIVILVGLIATYAAQTARDQAARSKVLVKQVAAEQQSLAAAQIQIAAQTRALCVQIRKGRVVFKNILDANGLVIASKISLVACPPRVKVKTP